MPPLLSHAPFSFYILCLLASSMSTHLSPLWMDLFFPAGNKRMCFEAEVVFAPAALLALGSFIEGLTERAGASLYVWESLEERGYERERCAASAWSATVPPLHASAPDITPISAPHDCPWKRTFVAHLPAQPLSPGAP